MEKKSSNIEIYRADEGELSVEVRLDENTVWLTQKQMATLFGTTPQNITLHLTDIFEEGELEERSTCKESLQVQKEGMRNIRRVQKYYNLDAILSIGYRVNSKKGTSSVFGPPNV